MMRRYYSSRPIPPAPKADDDDYDDDIPMWKVGNTITVHEQGETFQPIGILDANGDMIVARVRYPIGFLWHDSDGQLKPREHFLGRIADGDDESGSDDG